MAEENSAEGVSPNTVFCSLAARIGLRTVTVCYAMVALLYYYLIMDDFIFIFQLFDNIVYYLFYNSKKDCKSSPKNREVFPKVLGRTWTEDLAVTCVCATTTAWIWTTFGIHAPTLATTFCFCAACQHQSADQHQGN